MGYLRKKLKGYRIPKEENYRNMGYWKKKYGDIQFEV